MRKLAAAAGIMGPVLFFTLVAFALAILARNEVVAFRLWKEGQ